MLTPSLKNFHVLDALISAIKSIKHMKTTLTKEQETEDEDNLLVLDK